LLEQVAPQVAHILKREIAEHGGPAGRAIARCDRLKATLQRVEFSGCIWQRSVGDEQSKAAIAVRDRQYARSKAGILDDYTRRIERIECRGEGGESLAQCRLRFVIVGRHFDAMQFN
jgi:hypothetical protein